MRKYILLITIISGLCWFGCDEKEIALYQESPRLCIEYIPAVHFLDTDYVKQHTEKLVLVKIRLQGYKLKNEKGYCLKTEVAEGMEATVEVGMEDHYIFRANEILDSVYLVFKRPLKASQQEGKNGVTITFDYLNPKHEFAAGRIEEQSRVVSVDFYLPEPYNWHKTYWGEYSTAKYIFMMDYFKDVYKMTWGSQEESQKVQDAYEVYRKENGDLLDEAGKPITFPKF